MTVIAPTDQAALAAFGNKFWLNALQPLRAGEGLSDQERTFFQGVLITDVTRVDIVTDKNYGCSNEKTIILSFSPQRDVLDGMTLLRAVWAGYMLSLKATMDSGNNIRAHVGDDEDAVDLATATAAEIRATVTPCDEVYGSRGTYLELLEFGYDSATRVLTVEPAIGI